MVPKIVYIILVSIFSIRAGDLSYNEYAKELIAIKEREQIALPKIAQLKTSIAALKLEIDEVKINSEKIWEKILKLVGISQKDYDAFTNTLNKFSLEINNFESTYANDFSGWSKSIRQSEKKLAKLKKNKTAIIPRIAKLFTTIEQIIKNTTHALNMAKSSKASEPAKISREFDSYTVQLIPGNRDCLWRIAAKAEVYNNGEKWPKIYKANLNLIKNPDLLQPGQVLAIPR